MKTSHTRVTAYNPERQTVSLKLSEGIAAALDSLPCALPGGGTPSELDRKIWLQWALAEGIAALAARHEQGGTLCFDFGFEYAPRTTRQLVLNQQADETAAAIDAVLAASMAEPNPRDQAE